VPFALSPVFWIAVPILILNRPLLSGWYLKPGIRASGTIFMNFGCNAGSLKPGAATSAKAFRTQPSFESAYSANPVRPLYLMNCLRFAIVSSFSGR
jgi:hypothetical protein